MAKKSIFLTVGIIMLLVIGMISYTFYYSTKSRTVWDLIPKHAVLVFEFGECVKCKEELSNSVIGQIIKETFIPLNDSIRKQLNFLLSPQANNKVSAHLTGKNNFDLAFYFTKNDLNEVKAKLDLLRKNKSIQYSKRVLNDVDIIEYDFGSKTFTWAEVSGIGVGSFTSFLIEDVVRLSTKKGDDTFFSSINPIYKLPKVNNDPGNIYIYYPNFIKWLNAFATRPYIASLATAGLFDVKMNSSSIAVNGFSRVVRGDSIQLLSYFDEQSPVEFNLKQLISNRVASVYAYGISNPQLLFKDLISGSRKISFDSLQKAFRIDFNEILFTLDNELAQCNLEGQSGFDKILLFKVKNKKLWIDALERISSITEKEDSVFFERYSDYEIREIEAKNITSIIFGGLVDGFEISYYASIGNTFIVSDNLEQLKRYLEDIDREEVWGKSVTFNKFLETTLLESNVSVFVNTPLAIEQAKLSLSPTWESFLIKHNSLFKAFGLGAIQFSYLNDSFYTNAIFNFSDNTIPKSDFVSPEQNKILVSLPNHIVKGPFVVRNHVDRKDEIILQDSSLIIYLLSSDGKILWNRKLDSQIVGNVKQVDFFNNGKLQYFITTKKQLYVIDRLGNDVTPFPSNKLANEIQFNSVVDYDNSKKYRFLLSDRLGKLWMFDKELKNLEGWKPKNLEEGLATSMNHHRIRGKDFIIAIRRDGLVYLMNRRGELEKGFPLNLEARPEGDYFVEIGKALSESYFVCISRDGYKIKFNIEGKIVTKETLIKPSLTTQFSLVKEENGKSYIIKRQDSKNLTLLTSEGKELVVNGFCGNNPTHIQFLDYGGGKKFYVITDLTQELSFIYDANGIEIRKAPVSGRSISLSVIKEDNPVIYSTSDNTLIIER